MKKLFTLLTLALLSIGTAWAADYTVTATRVLSNENKTSTWSTIAANGGTAFQSGKTALGEGMYFVADGKCTLNGAQINVKANAIMYLEVPSATAAGSVTINNGNADDRYFETKSGNKVYMKTNNTLDFTSSDIEEVDGVNYLKLISKSDNKFYGVSITLTSGQYITILAAPTIEVAGATGTVTITAPSGASSVKYTTDGSEPSADNGTVYFDPFVADEGTIVKAIALGDGVSYANSSVASKQVLLTGIKMSTPTFAQFNGTVLLATTSPSASIYYTIDGTTPSTSSTLYKYPFTLTADATVKAIAIREGCTDSDVASESVNVITNTKAKTVVMGYGSFDGGDSKTLTGKSGDAAEGFVLTAGNKLQTGTQTNATLEKTYIKLPTNEKITLTMPDGWAATKITLYSFINTTTSSTATGWREVAGENYSTGDHPYTEIPMGAFSDVSGFNDNPDVRTYALNNATSVTFTPAGSQVCVIIAVDVIEAAAAEVGATGWATFVTPNALDFTGISDVKAYIVTGHSGNAITTTQMTGTVPANTPLLLEGATTAIPVAASSSTDVSANLLKAGAAISAEAGKTKYVLANNSGTATFMKVVSDVTVPASKAYLEFNEEISAPALSLSFGDVTGINEIQGAALKVNGYYDLLGRKVANPTKGLYIVNGKKVVIK